jgi:hypothetical protein
MPTVSLALGVFAICLWVGYGLIVMGSRSKAEGDRVGSLPRSRGSAAPELRSRVELCVTND